MAKKKPSSKRSTSRSIPRRTSRYARAEQSPINPYDPALRLIEEDMLRAEGSHTEDGLEIADPDQALAEQRELGGLGPVVEAHIPGIESKLPPDAGVEVGEPVVAWQLDKHTRDMGLAAIQRIREQHPDRFAGRRDPEVGREDELRHPLRTVSDAVKALQDLREQQADLNSLLHSEPPFDESYLDEPPVDWPGDRQV